MRCFETTDAYRAEILRIRKKYVSPPKASKITEPASTFTSRDYLCGVTAGLLNYSVPQPSKAFSMHGKGGDEA